MQEEESSALDRGGGDYHPSANAAMTMQQGSIKQNNNTDDMTFDNNIINNSTQEPSTTEQSHNDASTEDDDADSSDMFLPLRQVGALLHTIFLTKLRTPFPTFMEVFSPVLMMLVLVAAYQLSTSTHHNAATYSTMKFDVPGPWLSFATKVGEYYNTNDRRELMENTMPSRSSLLSLSQAETWDDLTRALVEMKQEPECNDEARSRRLQFSNTDELDEEEDEEDEFGDTNDFTDLGQYKDIFDLLNDARKQISRILKSPIGVPTFAQYVGFSKVLSSLISENDLPRILKDSTFGYQWGNLLTLGTLHLAPESSTSYAFWQYLNDTYPLMTELIQIRIHQTTQDALTFIDKTNLKERTWALLDMNTAAPSYTIRMNYTTVPNTNLITSWVAIGLNQKYQQYYLSGYLTLQRTLNDFYYHNANKNMKNCSSITNNLWSMPMPTAEYNQNAFFLAVGYLLGLTIAMAFLYPTSRLIKCLVEEKELRIKETLFIMGVRPWAYWLSWVLASLVIFFIMVIFMTWTLSSNVLIYSSPGYIFWYLFLFGTSSIGFCFFIAAMFSKAKLAATVGPIALFATLLPRFVFFGTNRYEATTAKYWFSLLPATAFAFGADIISEYEYAEIGVQSYNANEGTYSFNTTLGFLLLDTCLYMFLGWYLEQVIPRQYGVAKPWYFIFTWRYWCGNNKCCCWKQTTTTTTDELQQQQDTSTNPLMEQADSRLIPGVQIRDLVKRYSNNKHPPAVDHLSLTFYESQITALLGHNGAGKSTTVSVLTGLYPPTEGDCFLYGRSVNQDDVRQEVSIGICPQQNVLYDRLTVSEHLKLFQRLKKKQKKHDSNNIAMELGLREYLQTPACALSGGNKRKLSVAIALIGNPRVLILDEPTSAMDPKSRRACWDVLRKRKIATTIILTTHFMDEAEVLSDRIAIMQSGKLTCCGSSVFLKQQYGLGYYNMTVVVNEDNNVLQEFWNEHIPGTRLIRRSGRERTFAFPHGSELLFPNALDALDRNKEKLGVVAYGMASTTLEQVFLRLAQEEEEKADDDKQEETGNDEDKPDLDAQQEQEQAIMQELTVPPADGEQQQHDEQIQQTHLSPLAQIGLLYWKRYTIQKRDWKGAFFALILPVLLVGLVLLVLMINPNISGQAITLSPSLYGKSTQIVVGGGASIKPQNTSPASIVEHEFEQLRHLNHYDNAQMSLITKATTSTQVSNYLLDTYNNRSHSVRFGAYVLDDLIPVLIKINWNTIASDVQAIAEMIQDNYNWNNVALMVHDVDFSRVLSEQEMLSITTSDVIIPGSLQWKIATKHVYDYVRKREDLPDPLFNMSELQEWSHSAVVNITSEWSLENKTYPEWRAEMEVLVGKLWDQVNVTNATQWIQWSNHLIRDMIELTNDETRPVNALWHDFLDNITAVLQEQVWQDGDVWQDLLDVIIFKEEWNDMLYDNITAVIANSATLPGVVRNVVDNAVAIWRENDIGQELQDFVYNDLWNNITNVLSRHDIDNETIASIWKNITAVWDSGDEAAWQEIKTTYDATMKEHGNDAIRNATRLMRELYNALFVECGDCFSSLQHTVDAILKDWTNNTGFFYSVISSATSSSSLAAPIVLADVLLNEYIERYGMAETITQRNVFEWWSEQLGGTASDLDGSILVDFSSAVLAEIESDDITISDIVVSNTAGETLMKLEGGVYSLSATLDTIKSWLPHNTTQYTFDVSSRASILHNSSSAHAVAVFNQAYMEYLYQACTGNQAARLVSINYPLPLTTQQSIEIKTILSILASLFILIPYNYIPGAFIVFLVKERVSKSKHLQLVSGVNMSSYWIASYLWDVTLFFFMTLLVMLVFLMYGTNSAQVFVGDAESFFCTMALTFGYGLSVLPFAYLWSRLFTNHSSAQIAVVGIVFLSGFVAVNAYFIMNAIDSTRNVAQALRPVFRLLPAYNVGEGLISMSEAFWRREVLGGTGNPFDWEVAGKSMTLLFVLAPPYFLLLLLLEYSHDGGSGGVVGKMLRSIRGMYHRMQLRWYNVDIDDNDNEQRAALLEEDVVREQDNVREHREELRESASVLLVNLWKVYPPSGGIMGSMLGSVQKFLARIFCFCCRRPAPAAAAEVNDDEDNEQEERPKQAVRGLTTAISPGETYALLGQNGAGKTTTMGVLTGDITATSGEAYVAGHDVTGNTLGGVSEARKNIGFCPQADPLLDLMTGRETLAMFAKLRGIPRNSIDAVVNDLLDRLTLTPHADKVTQSYSGGNKRKCSLGVALVGNPRVLFIDESSSGLDPVARRKMWDLIAEIAQDRSVMLTTHFMQEAEALCTRVAIMRKGQLVCLGSVQELKSKYLNGMYSIQLYCKIGTPNDVVDLIWHEITTRVLPVNSQCRLVERHGRFISLEAEGDDLRVGTLFERMQALKENSDCVENYSISQSSLEEVFLKLVADNNNDSAGENNAENQV